MHSWMDKAKCEKLITELKEERLVENGRPEVFAVESCIHDRHIKPQIFADLTGENWRLDEYEKEGVSWFKANPGAFRSKNRTRGGYC